MNAHGFRHSKYIIKILYFQGEKELSDGVESVGESENGDRDGEEVEGEEDNKEERNIVLEEQGIIIVVCCPSWYKWS